MSDLDSKSSTKIDINPEWRPKITFCKKNRLNSCQDTMGKYYMTQKAIAAAGGTNDFFLASQLLNNDKKQENFLAQDTFIINLAQTSSLNKKIQHVAFDMDGVLVDFGVIFTSRVIFRVKNENS